MAVQAFKVLCNFADCDPLCFTNCSDHNATPTTAVILLLSVQ